MNEIESSCMVVDAAPETAPVSERRERVIRQVDYAKEIGVNKNTLKQWIRAGMPTVGNMVPVARANQWRREHRRRTIAIGRKSSVYFAQRASDGAIKIGFSSEVPRRLIEVRKKVKCKITLLGTSDGGSATERRLHRRFTHLHIDGEWFTPGDDLLAFIRDLDTPEVQAVMVERDYKFHTLNASQCATFCNILERKPIGRAEQMTNTLKSLEARGLIRVVGRRASWLPDSKFAVPDDVRAAWCAWGKRTARPFLGAAH